MNWQPRYLVEDDPKQTELVRSFLSRICTARFGPLASGPLHRAVRPRRRLPCPA